MKSLIHAITFLILFCFSLPAYAEDVLLKVGQVWSYKTRPNEENSRLVILKVEQLNGVDIVHVAIKGVSLVISDSPDAIINVIEHLPFDQNALKGSLAEVVGNIHKLPDYEGGYSMWRHAFDAGQAGVFNTTIAESVDFVQMSINRH